MVSAQAIQNVLGGRVSGNSVHLPTPGHSKQDQGTVVTIEPTAPDGLLVHSFNGGDPLEIKDRLREAGILPPLGDNTKAKPSWRETGVYEYYNADGSAVYRTKRLEATGEGKRFVAERRDGSRWMSGIKGVARVPYGLPDLVKACKAAKNGERPLVYFVEGERKADKLKSWGLLATAIAFGAKGWRESYATYLQSCRVVILPDNDSPGAAFAEQVKAGIEEAGGEALILDLPGLPPKGDIMDWSGSLAGLSMLTDAAIAGEAMPIKTLDLEALSKVKPKPKAFAIERVAPIGEVTLFTGAGSAGKSLLGQQIATCAAAGVQCLGLDVAKSPAIYLSCEDDEEQLHYRQTCICEALKVSMSGLSSLLHLASLRGELDNPLASFDREGSLTPSAAFSRLSRTIKTTEAKLAILDNLAHLFTGNENDRGEVTQFVNLLNRLAGETGAAILLIGHPNKAGADYSGSTAWLNAVRSQVFLDHDAQTDVRTLSVNKANYAQKGEAIRFLWVDGAFVKESELPPDRAAALESVVKANHDNSLFLTCLREMTRQKRAVSEKRSSTFAPKVFAQMPESKGIGKDRLEEAMNRLFRIDAIERGELPWRSSDRKAVEGLRETQIAKSVSH